MIPLVLLGGLALLVLAQSGGGSSGDGSITVTGYTPDDSPCTSGTPTQIQVVPVTTDGQYFLRSDIAPQFLAMMADFYASGGDPNVHVNSAFRDMASQTSLYNCYVAYQAGGPCNCNNQCEQAAKPGCSNHQQGTAVDIGGLGGYGTASYNWFANNAARYGFYNKVKGEYWHWSIDGF